MRIRLALIVLVLVLPGAGCAAFTPPPNLNPNGRLAFYQAHAEQPLDILRDAAVDAERVGLLPNASKLKVVTVHRQAIVTIHDAKDGWRRSVADSLRALVKDLPDADGDLVRPYVDAALTWLQEAQ